MSIETPDELLLRQQKLINEMHGENAAAGLPNPLIPADIALSPVYPLETDRSLSELELGHDNLNIKENAEISKMLRFTYPPVRPCRGGHWPSADAQCAPLQGTIEYPTAQLEKIWRSSLTGLIFYILLIVAVVSMLLLRASDENSAPRNFGGFSAMIVLTKSMQSEIPQDSLVITRQTDTGAINVGDDITFFRNESTTVTHRVVAIFENYADTGKRGFRTKGVDNAAPDEDIVLADNIIGKVIFHSKLIGQFFRFIKNNILLSAVTGILVLGLFYALMMIFGRESQKQKKDLAETHLSSAERM